MYVCICIMYVWNVWWNQQNACFSLDLVSLYLWKPSFFSTCDTWKLGSIQSCHVIATPAGVSANPEPNTVYRYPVYIYTGKRNDEAVGHFHPHPHPHHHGMVLCLLLEGTTSRGDDHRHYHMASNESLSSSHQLSFVVPNQRATRIFIAHVRPYESGRTHPRLLYLHSKLLLSSSTSTGTDTTTPTRPAAAAEEKEKKKE